MFKAGVLIDVHAVNAAERESLGRALEMYMFFCTGRFKELLPYFELALSKELELKQIEKIKGLILKIDRVLWKGRKRWSMYDRQRVANNVFLAYSLQQRLLQNETEVARAADHIQLLQNGE